MDKDSVYNHIVFIGPSGVGKSLIATKVARKTGIPLRDLDKCISASAGVDITWIFDQEGETGFRKREYNELKLALAGERAIISTGGGTITTPECHTLLTNPNLVIIYLSATLATLQQRLRYTRNRPMLGSDKTQKNARIAQLLKERVPIYESLAQVTIACDRLYPNAIVKKVLEHVSD